MPRLAEPGPAGSRSGPERIVISAHGVDRGTRETVASINWTRLLVMLLTILVAIVLVSFVLWVGLHFAGELLVFFLAAIVAYLLAPLVDGVHRRTRLARPICILLVYIAIGLVVVALGALLVPPVTDQARAFQARLPALLRQLDVESAGIEQTLRAHGIILPVRGVAGNAAGAIGGVGPTVLGGVLRLASSIGSGLVDAVLVLVIAFYLVNDRDSIGRALAAVVPDRYAPGAAFAARSAGNIIGRYVRAQLAVACTVGLLGGIGAAVLGVQYAPLIGIFAFLAESIPVLGPIIATVPAVLIALLESPWKALAILAWFVVVQQLEQNVIMPRLSGQAVGIHPVAAIMAVLIGFNLGSFWGALFAVPLLGYVVALAREAWRVYLAVPHAPPGAETEPHAEAAAGRQ